MNISARNILRENHIVTNGGLIIGVPGETKPEMWDTIKFGLTLDFPDFAILRPYPKTRWGENNDEYRDKYRQFNEGWCFLHDNPALVERLHKVATFLAWFHPKRVMAFFSPDDFRRGFCRWRYQVYTEVMAKRILDKIKCKLQGLAALLPGVKKPEQLPEGMEEYRFLPPAELPENPAAAAPPEMVAQLARSDGAGGGNGERERDKKGATVGREPPAGKPPRQTSTSLPS
jgi:hypothetical protein